MRSGCTAVIGLFPRKAESKAVVSMAIAVHEKPLALLGSDAFPLSWGRRSMHRLIGTICASLSPTTAGQFGQEHHLTQAGLDVTCRRSPGRVLHPGGPEVEPFAGPVTNQLSIVPGAQSCQGVEPWLGWLPLCGKLFELIQSVAPVLCRFSLLWEGGPLLPPSSPKPAPCGLFLADLLRFNRKGCVVFCRWWSCLRSACPAQAARMGDGLGEGEAACVLRALPCLC